MATGDEIVSGERPQVVLTGSSLTSGQLTDVALGKAGLRLNEAAWEGVRAGRRIVERIAESGQPTYGITTGVGAQRDYGLAPEVIAQFNRRLLAAHATRVPGPTLTPEAVRGALVVIANGFATGRSGVSEALLRLVIERANSADMPSIDASGSVGASDLVPLAQLALWILDSDPKTRIELPGAKEGLSLINSNAISLSQGALALSSLERLMAAFDIAAAVSLEGIRGNLQAISESATTPHARRGQAGSAQRLRQLLRDSALWQPGSARFLQDPLSFRCISQVHGAAFEVLTHATEIWNEELNTLCDNPLIDLENGIAVSHGNMDSTRLTLAMDYVRQALGKVIDLSSERMNKQHWPAFSGLPTGLSEEGAPFGGVQFLNLSQISASLVTSTKMWARPTLLHSVGQLADGIEDTASHAVHAVHDLGRIIDAGFKVAAIELMIGCWAIRRRGLAAEDIGRGLRPALDATLPLLPLGREGEAPLSLRPFVELLTEGDLVERCLGSAGATTEPLAAGLAAFTASHAVADFRDGHPEIHSNANDA